MEARGAARTLEPLNENGDEQEGENGGNENGGNGGNRNGGNRENGNGGNGHRNGNHGMNYGGFMPVARECTFQDFLKCKPHNFLGTEGVVRLTRWFEKMETVFNISNCPPKYQVKYATCTLQDSSLTWWNSHKRTIGVDAAYAMNWAGLMRLMTEQKKTEWKGLWRFTRSTLPRECDFAANPARLQDAIRIANQMMDKKRAAIVQTRRGLQLEFLQGYYLLCVWIRPGHFRNVCPTSRNQNVESRHETRMEHDWKQMEVNEARRELTPLVEEEQTLIPTLSILTEFPKSFNKDLPGYYRLLDQVVFQIELVHGVAPVARAPYRLAPAKMQELSTQLQELSDRKMVLFQIDIDIVELKQAYCEEPDTHYRDRRLKEFRCFLRKIEAIKDWASPKIPTEIRQFIGSFECGREKGQEAAIPVVESNKWCSAPILALPEGSENFMSASLEPEIIPRQTDRIVKSRSHIQAALGITVENMDREVNKLKRPEADAYNVRLSKYASRNSKRGPEFTW
ncbi:hypothetical protein Tco_0619302 [Tanacetum coccineum]